MIGIFLQRLLSCLVTHVQEMHAHTFISIMLLIWIVVGDRVEGLVV